MVDLNFKKVLIAFTSILMLFMVGCSNGIEEKGDTIIVEKRIGEEYKYERYKEVIESDEVIKIKEILEDIKWEEGVVDTVLPPEYKFYFEEGGTKTSDRVYDIWANLDGNTSLLVIEGESKFVQNNKNVTNQLFEIITKHN